MSVCNCGRPHYAKGLCKRCYHKNWIHKNDRIRRYNIRRKFKIELEVYEELFSAQQGKCAICGTQKPSTHGGKGKGHFGIDHCHSSGNIRGLLCGYCNTGLGAFKDDTELLAKAIQYLRFYK